VEVTGERTVRAGAIGRPATSAVGCIIQTDFVVNGKHNFELVAFLGSNVLQYWRAKPVLQISLVRRVGAFVQIPLKWSGRMLKWSFAEYLIQPPEFGELFAGFEA
jgi:hypothetical protein